MVRFVGVSLVYPNGTRALADVNLHIPKGEFVFITGTSGSGKSSLLQLVYREREPTEGSVVVAGQDVAAMDRSRVPYLRRQIGIVFQDFRLLPQLQVRENVGFALDVVGASRREKSRKVPIALELVGLSHKAEAFPDELSGGEQQRVSIARALVNNPSLLLADEPTGNLDPETSWEIVQLLSSISERGTTVVVATHDKYIVDGMRRRVIALAQGVVIRDDEGGAYDHA
jgi:cell division transport system ATP-binding protein